MSNEYLRKSIHMLVLIPALLLRWIPPSWALFFAWIAVFINFFLLQRFEGGIFRDLGKRRDWGIVIYTIAVFILVLLFYPNIYVAVGAFAIQALGDGVATMAGLTFGGPRLPWNRKKTWSGLVGFFLASLLAVFVMKFVEPSLSISYWIFPMIIAGAVCAVVESLHIGVNDNLTVPLAGGAVLAFFYHLRPAHLVEHVGVDGLVLAVLVSAGAMLLLRALGWLSTRGAVAAAFIGFFVWIGDGGPLFLLLALFLALASLATLCGRDEKRKLGIAPRDAGRRGARNLLASGIVAAFCALWFAGTGDELWRIAAVAALATALGDAISSQLGPLAAPRPFHMLTLAPARPGDSGAISMRGTLLGGLASALFAVVAFAVGSIPLLAVPLVITVAQLGNLLDSFLGDTLERLGILDNDSVNFCATLFGAGMVLWWGEIVWLY